MSGPPLNEASRLHGRVRAAGGRGVVVRGRMGRPCMPFGRPCIDADPPEKDVG